MRIPLSAYGPTVWTRGTNSTRHNCRLHSATIQSHITTGLKVKEPVMVGVFDALCTHSWDFRTVLEMSS